MAGTATTGEDTATTGEVMAIGVPMTGVPTAIGAATATGVP